MNFKELEGDLPAIQQEVQNLIKDDPHGIGLCFALVFFARIEEEYKDFIKDVDLDVKDKENILEGFLYRSNRDIDEDEAADLGFQILNAYASKRHKKRQK